MMTRIAAGSGSTFARIALLFMLGGLLQACSVVDWVKGIGSGSSSEEKEALKPAPLVDFSAETELYKVWSAGVGNGQGKEYNRLQVALDGTTIFLGLIKWMPISRPIRARHPNAKPKCTHCWKRPSPLSKICRRICRMCWFSRYSARAHTPKLPRSLALANMRQK